MKILLTCLVASLAISASSLAQTSTGTTTKGTMTVYAEVPSGSIDASKTTPTATGGKSVIISGITVMATSTGQVQYAIDPNGISYTDPTTPQTVSTHDIYDAIAAQAVTDGVARGYHPASTSTGGTTTKVYDASSTVREFSIQYDQSTYTPTVTETKESVVTSTVQ
jgi:hypothetical protein